MRTAIVAMMLLATAALAAEPALAHGSRGRVQFGIHFGAPFYGPPFHYPYHPVWPYYHYPYPAPVYVVPHAVPPEQPRIWIERESAQPAAPVPGFWYYCPEARAYYPSVGACPGGWQRVPPQPPPG